MIKAAGDENGLGSCSKIKIATASAELHPERDSVLPAPIGCAPHFGGQMKNVTPVIVLGVMLATACDTPVDTVAVSQAVLLNATTIEANVGEVVNLDNLLKFDVGLATGGGAVASATRGNQVDDWFVTCLASGMASLSVYAKQGGVLSSKTIICKQPQPIGQYIGHWLNLNREFNAVTLQVSVYGDAQTLQFRADRGSTEVRCSAIGTYRYLIITLPGSASQWYLFECRPGMPLAPIPPPRVGIPANFTKPFRDQGLGVQAVAVWPPDLAQPVVISASISMQPQQELRPAVPGATVASAEAGDIGVVCQREGEGKVQVSIDSDDQPEYTFICHPPHDQGSGG
jgi:hypothetical protein